MNLAAILLALGDHRVEPHADELPLQAGEQALVGVLDKSSEFATRAVHEWTAQVFREAGYERATMAEIFDGPPSFTDLTVVLEYTP